MIEKVAPSDFSSVLLVEVPLEEHAAKNTMDVNVRTAATLNAYMYVCFILSGPPLFSRII